MSRERERHKSSHYSRDRDRDRSRERDKHSSRDGSRHEGSSSSRRSEHREHRDRDRDRRRSSRDKSRSRSRSRSRDRSRHRDRRSGGEGQPDQQQQPDGVQQQPEQHANGLSAEQQAEAHKKKREAEQDALDAEMEERRKRVEEWRKKRAAEAAAAAAAEQERKQQEEAAAAAAAAAEAEAGGKKGWSFEDDEDDDEPQQQQQDGDEVDPLDAFMAGNTSAAAAAAPPAAAAAVKQEQQQQQQDVTMTDADNPDRGQQQAAGTGGAAAAEDEEPDPLDAFMANEVLPEVRKPPQQPPPPAAAAAEEPDPLDAFMASEVLPEVQKVRFSQPEAPAAPAAAKAADAGTAAGTAAEAPAGTSAAAGPTGTGTGSTARVIIRPGSSGGRRILPAAAAAAAGSKGGGGAGASKPGGKQQKQQQRRRQYYDTSSESDWTDSEDEGPQEEAELDDETWAKNVTAGKLSKGDRLAQVDHAAVEYEPFRRRFYIEVPEIQRLTEEEVALARKTEGIKVRGVDVPRPVKTWTQCGINVKVLDVLKRNGCERPLSIQAQALPIIMSGRDCIGIAKTGSGKTLAFVLPLLRHIRDQSELRDGDGPIGLIMAPTRELVQQIAKEVKRFGSPMSISCTPVFGGAGVANQITELKRGTEVVAATPGRLIDLLVSRVTNLRRVTYLVLDEADRMFDMGFEPQITRIISNTRPDRQTVLFSATFPRAVETLARQILNNPVEIQVGGRSVVNADIAQFVEIRPESDRFLRLLEILGEWYEVGKVIIFVHSQDNCDNLFRDLLKAGYPCLSLHGGKDQSDRECTISDFKGAVCNILVATSIAARGLDVRDLVLVVNYDVPNHHEDYVHRVGRTGRAGNKGTAITFIGPDEDRYAPDLVKALKESSASVPQDLQELADAFNAKRKQGLVQGHGSGYGGSGFKFDKAEDSKIRQARKSKAKEFGIVGQEDEEEGASDSDDDSIRPSTGQQQQQQGAAAGQIVVTPAAAAAVAAAINGPGAAGLPGAPKFLPAQPGQQFPGQAVPQAASALVAAAAAAAAQVSGGVAPPAAAAAAAGVPASASLAAAQAAAMRAAALAAAYAQGGGAPAAAAAAATATAQQQQKPTGFESEIEINDFPQSARWKVTHKGFQQEITDLTGAAVTTKGIYVAAGGQPPEGERKLYLLIEAPTEAMVKRAKQEVRRVIEEMVEKAMRRDVGAAGTRKYNIM